MPIMKVLKRSITKQPNVFIIYNVLTVYFYKVSKQDDSHLLLKVAFGAVFRVLPDKWVVQVVKVRALAVTVHEPMQL